MFDQLTERLSSAVAALRGKGRISEDNIKDALRQVRMALLEADVALPVVKVFIEQVREKALGEKVLRSLTPGQALIKIVHGELVAIMGEGDSDLNLRTQPPAVILLAGLQGAGKTTSAAKLARFLIERQKKKVLLASADVYRPAAILQLQRLAEQVGAGFVPSEASEAPRLIAMRALEEARRSLADVLILDTAGRQHVDEDMMEEIKLLHATVSPIETLFVVDSMAGQDAVNAARAFSEALPLSGVILTKADGDARGGAALSVRHITGCPIKFLGVGEKIDALERFHPERLASRILGMGDVLGLVEEVERKVDKDQAEKLARKVQKGKGLDLLDLREQLQQMLNMGGLSALLDKLPMGGKLPAGMADQAGDKQIRRQIAIINSMTPQERKIPAVINGSRKRRIALGSGVQIQDVNRLLKQHKQMQKMMKNKKLFKQLASMNKGGFRG
ncbi:MAG: signal recognition particle protein [Gammaproteobacteria bacterium]|jgi:signal recognition particle subunit SRP54|nr:signal recognition particle protein [Gammaproteobacteria bacterium]